MCAPSTCAPGSDAARGAAVNEFDLIRRHFAAPASGAVTLGVGDDAALLQPPEGREIAVSCDTLVSGRHFLPDDDPAGIAWKALNVNLSDLAAMGAEAECFLLALTLPAFDGPWLDTFADGLRRAAGAAGVPLAGGDITRGPLAITITAVGSVEGGGALRRCGARAGDLLCVTGTLGDAAAALAGADEPALRERLHRPTARLAAGRALRGLARAAIDVSDGLLADVGHLCASSSVGAVVRADLLPCSDALAAHPDDDTRLAWQATGGDDYELAVALAPEVVETAVTRCREVATPLTVVGRFTTAKTVRLLRADGTEAFMESGGYRHF